MRRDEMNQPPRGLILVNLGSPARPDEASIRRFLRAFLSDRRVVHWPRAVWLPVLHGIVARVRPGKIAPVYRQIWLPEGSPLQVYTQRLTDQVQAALPDVLVRYAMVYTEPSLAAVLDEFRARGVSDVTVVPLYPQYAPSTVGSVFDQLRDYQRAHQYPADPRVVTDYFTQPDYINWYARNLARRVYETDPRHPVDRVFFSFHSVPVARVHGGQAYRDQCLATVAAIVNHPDFAALRVDYEVTFQSKFGPGKWLTPATIDTLSQHGKLGLSRLVLVCTPGFVADCIETLDEIDVLNREAFLAAGGEHFQFMSPLNDDPAGADMVVDLFHNWRPEMAAADYWAE